MSQDDVLRELDMLEADVLMALCKLSGATYDAPTEGIEGKKITVRNASALLDYLERVSVDEIIADLPPSAFAKPEQITQLKSGVPGFRAAMKLDIVIRYESGDPEV